MFNDDYAWEETRIKKYRELIWTGTRSEELVEEWKTKIDEYNKIESPNEQVRKEIEDLKNRIDHYEKKIPLGKKAQKDYEIFKNKIEKERTENHKCRYCGKDNATLRYECRTYNFKGEIGSYYCLDDSPEWLGPDVVVNMEPVAWFCNMFCYMDC